MGKEYVVCQICGSHLKFISYAHLHMHNIKAMEYMSKYPNQQLMCESVRSKIGLASRQNWKNSDFGCNKISYRHTLSANMTRLRADINSSYNNSQWREKQRLTRLRLWRDPKCKLNSPETRIKWTMSSGKPLSEDAKRKISQHRKELWAKADSPYRTVEYANNMAMVQKKRLLKDPHSSPNIILAGSGRSKEKISRPQSRLYNIIVTLFPKYHVEFNFPVNTGNTVRYVDVALVDKMIGFEYDEPYWHDEENDRIRDEELENVGWGIYRCKGLKSLDKLEKGEMPDRNYVQKGGRYNKQVGVTLTKGV